MKQQQPLGHREISPPTLASLLISARKVARLTQTEMARQLRISRTELARLEAGKVTHPSPVLLGKLVKIFHVKVEDLYAITGYLPATELPSFGPYLRALHPDWPDSDIDILAHFHEFLRCQHPLL